MQEHVNRTESPQEANTTDLDDRPNTEQPVVHTYNMFRTQSCVPGDELSGAATPVAARDQHRNPLGETMQVNANAVFGDPTCACGALLGHGQSRCRKCHARDRWQRRARRTNRGTRTGGSMLLALGLLAVSA